MCIILKDQSLLYAFMQFLKSQGAVYVLQFCLDVGKSTCILPFYVFLKEKVFGVKYLNLCAWKAINSGHATFWNSSHLSSHTKSFQVAQPSQELGSLVGHHFNLPLPPDFLWTWSRYSKYCLILLWQKKTNMLIFHIVKHLVQGCLHYTLKTSTIIQKKLIFMDTE